MSKAVSHGVRLAALSAFLLGAAAPAYAQSAAGAVQAYQELLKSSEEKKRGLTFYVQGQSIPGVVTKIGSDTIEVRNQTHGRIIIRLDRIDAIAAN